MLGPLSAAPGCRCSVLASSACRMRIWSGSFGRFAVWLPGAAVLFAERGERRDFFDEFRPQNPGQVMAHAGESHEAAVRDGSGDGEASARCNERVMEAVDD